MGPDAALTMYLSKVQEDGRSFILAYTGVPTSGDQHAKSQDPPYEMDDEDAYLSTLHSDLKRDLRVRADNSTQASLPLFEKYQFLSPRKCLLLHWYVKYTSLTRLASTLYGSLSDAPSRSHPLRRHLRHRRTGSELRRIQQGDGSAGAESWEAAVIQSRNAPGCCWFDVEDDGSTFSCIFRRTW
jgi:hypothetical protein